MFMKQSADATKLYEEIAALREQVRILQTERHERNVNSFLSALVRTSPEVFDAVAFSGSGGVIGVPAMLGWSATGHGNAVHVWGICVLGGVVCAGLRLFCSAIDLPLIVEGVVEKVLDQKTKSRIKPAGGLRDFTLTDKDGTRRIDHLPTVSQFEYTSRVIPSCNTQGSERTISTDKLCAYLKFITATGERRKDYRPDYINQKEWPDVRDWLQSKGWWDLPPHSPTLPRACAEIRGAVTNGTE